MVTVGYPSAPKEGTEAIMPQEQEQEPEKRRFRSHSQLYGAVGDSIGNLGDNCPTCRGIGRIPRKHDQLVAVISCSDKRLRPSRTKLYVCISVVLCLLICFLILFFLFPRSISLSSVTVQSVRVFFTPDKVEMQVTNVFNFTNDNFAEMKVLDFDMQVLIDETVMGRIKISNMTSVKSRSEKLYTVVIPIIIEDPGLNNYCKSTSIRIHTLFLLLQMTMNVSYLAHSEQLSKDTFEYIDCGANTTIPHPIGQMILER
ncbi:transmembrane protein 106B-like [Salvelinus namaycush]|uniref:Transmembrane protein 106B-like n=1 Tax=Salvelinus namaycush TaxID=8040 RepID=A0A8U0QPX0_SALNM|nr:transmembrane protein 106B-like [Salvelinus namaycush]XP_038847381.1 transmembrane protein 106B-like [Salvelinus namaycush]XP_038847382.1 transmembrane protein 106B-like [Salvelinus namaycush]XP_038847383.1 transmembrane protein 106B-like [Salvelinus namaycush]